MDPLPQLLFSASVVVVCLLVFMFFAVVIAIPVFGFESLQCLRNGIDVGNPESITILKYFQTIQAIGLFIVSSLLLGYLFLGNSFEYLHLNKKVSASGILAVIILMIFILPFINLLSEWNSNMSLPGWMSGIEESMRNAEDNASRITEAFLNVKTIPALFFNIFMIALLPAIGEELLFRGVIQRIFTRMTCNTHWGIWISATLFSAIHFQFYGFVPRLFLGALFGYLLVWSGSMWLPVVGHFINNALAVIVSFLISNEMINPKFEEFGSTQDSSYAAVVGLLVVAVLLFLIKKENREKQLLCKKRAGT